MKKLFITMLALIMMISLVACDLTDNGNQDDDVTDQWEPGEQGSKENSDDGYRFDITEDDHTVIIIIGNTRQVFTHDGVNVTGYTTYVDCEDAETARLVAGSINPNDSYYAGLGLKSVTVKGQYVVQEYSEEGFPCKTYEELRDMADAFKQIKDAE